jgi:SAM-dependent methyltransferase
LGNLFAPPAHWFGSFDWIWEHTCFCAIDPTDRERYVAAVHRLLKPHGSLLATFFIDPGLDPDEEGPPFGVSEAELDALFARHFVLEKQWPPRACFPGREGREHMRLLRRIN